MGEIKVPFKLTDVLVVPRIIRVRRAKEAARKTTQTSAVAAEQTTVITTTVAPAREAYKPITITSILLEDKGIGTRYDHLPVPSPEARQIAQAIQTQGFSELIAKLPPELYDGQHKDYDKDTGYESDFSTTRRINIGKQGEEAYELLHGAFKVYKLHQKATGGERDQDVLATSPTTRNGKPWRMMVYYMPLPNLYDGGGRSASAQLWFGAPEEIAAKLLIQLPKKPELMDEVFRALYPRIVSRDNIEEIVGGRGDKTIRYTGIRRNETHGLKVINCLEGKPYQPQINDYRYSKPISY